MKYIDADKLKKIVEQAKQRALKAAEVDEDMYSDGRADAFGEVLLEIDSLQQDQPETSSSLVDVDAVREDFITNVYRVLDADPTNDRANAIIDAFDSLPTVCREQPEVDFEEEWEKFNGWMETYNQSDYPTSYTTKDIARYFAEWGANHLKARKEE